MSAEPTGSPYAMEAVSPAKPTVSAALTVATFGGIEDGVRAAGVLALYGVTPERLVLSATIIGGLQIKARVNADQVTLERIERRMRALPCVASAVVKSVPARLAK